MSASALTRWEQSFRAAHAALQQQRLDDAEASIRAALDAANQLGDPAVHAQSWTLMAQLRTHQEQLDAADSAMERAVDAAGRVPAGSEDPAFALALNNLARMYSKRKAHSRAEPLLRRLLVIKQRDPGSQLELATVYANLGKLLHAQKKFDDAEDCWRFALAIRERVLPADDLAIAAALEGIADACDAQRKHGQVRAMRDRANAIREVITGEQRRPAPGSAFDDGPTPSLSLEHLLYIPPGAASAPAAAATPERKRGFRSPKRERQVRSRWRKVKVIAALLVLGGAMYSGWALHARFGDSAQLAWIVARALVGKVVPTASAAPTDTRR